MSSSAAPSPGRASSGASTLYRERLLPSPLVWLVAPAAGVALWFMFSALHTVLGMIIAVAGAVVIAALLWRTSPVIEVRTDSRKQRWLHAGTARIETDYLGPAEELDVNAMRQAMGPELRLDAHVCHRPWIHTGVRITVQDTADPTPYWLVATRFPERLCAALDIAD